MTEPAEPPIDPLGSSREIEGSPVLPISDSAEKQLLDHVVRLLNGIPEIQRELADRRRESAITLGFHSGNASGDKPAGYVEPNEMYRRQEKTYRKFWQLHYDAERTFTMAVALSGAVAKTRDAFQRGTWRTGEWGLPPQLLEEQCTLTQIYLERLRSQLETRQMMQSCKGKAADIRGLISGHRSFIAEYRAALSKFPGCASVDCLFQSAYRASFGEQVTTDQQAGIDLRASLTSLMEDLNEYLAYNPPTQPGPGYPLLASRFANFDPSCCSERLFSSLRSQLKQLRNELRTCAADQSAEVARSPLAPEARAFLDLAAALHPAAEAPASPPPPMDLIPTPVTSSQQQGERSSASNQPSEATGEHRSQDARVDLFMRIIKKRITTIPKWAALHKLSRTSVYDWRSARISGKPLKSKVSHAKIAEIEGVIEAEAKELGLITRTDSD